jgi:hypothetical protein
MWHKAYPLRAPAIPETDAVPMTARSRAFPRLLPYVLSWGVLAVAMLIGLTRVPLVLYTPIDGDWAKWNVEATLHFGKIFDLSPYSMLAGMGSMYFPNLPWLNPGALALGLPLGADAKAVASYAVYAAELAVSIVLLARVIGFSWLIATIGAQLYLYLLFPPFSEVFRIYSWYSLAPYYAHLQSALNVATALFLLCGRIRDWRGNVALCVAFLALFISGLLSAPFTFVFATPAYVAISAAVVLARPPPRAELTWKTSALLLCVLFFVGSRLLDYYLGTIATAARTPNAPIAWEQLLSAGAWLALFRDHPLCQDPRLLLCFQNRGAWLLIAALIGAVITIVTRRRDLRAVALAFIAYIGFAHLYAYAYQAQWLGAASVLSHHFLLLSSWSFTCVFAAVALVEPWRMLASKDGAAAGMSGGRRLAGQAVAVALAVLAFVIVVSMLRYPYDTDRYRAVQLMTGVAAAAALLLAMAAVGATRGKQPGAAGRAGPAVGWRDAAVLAVVPTLALVHLSMGVRDSRPAVRDASLRDYLAANASIEVGQPFRGYASTIWVDKYGDLRSAHGAGYESERYAYGRDFYRARYGETFTETDLWRFNIPTLEEYGEWSSVQAHGFMLRLLAPAGTKAHSNYLRAFTIDSDILRVLGVRYVVTDADALDQPATLRASVSAPGAPTVRLFELSHVNLGTYSPTRFVQAATADEIAQRIRENKDRLDRVAVVSEDIASASMQARNVVMTVERDGVRVQAASDGPAHILLPVQFSHCLVVANGAHVRLRRANLFQTLLSFDGPIDARIKFHFGLFADNACRLRDGLDNRALGLS